MRKLNNDGRAIDVSAHLPALVERLARVPGLVAAYLFGSYGTPDQSPLSDVDLALLFRRDSVPGFERQLALIGLVTEALEEEDVSVTFLNRAPLSLQYEVLRTGRALMVVDDDARADFQETVVDRWCDFAVDFEVFRRDYDAALVEDLGSGSG